MSQIATQSATQTAAASGKFLLTEEILLARMNRLKPVTHAMCANGYSGKFRILRHGNIMDATQNGGPMVDSRTGEIIQKQIMITDLWNDSIFESPKVQALLTQAEQAQTAGDAELVHELLQQVERLCTIEYGHLLGRVSVPPVGKEMEGTLTVFTSKKDGTAKLILDGVIPVEPKAIAGRTTKRTSLFRAAATSVPANEPSGEGNGITPDGQKADDIPF